MAASARSDHSFTFDVRRAASTHSITGSPDLLQTNLVVSTRPRFLQPNALAGPLLIKIHWPSQRFPPARHFSSTTGR